VAEELTSIPKTKSPKGKQTRKAAATERSKRYAEVRKSETKLVKAEVKKAVEGEVVPGRPTLFTQALADEICAGIAAGYSMRGVVNQEHMPAMTTVFRWLRENDEFRQQYTRATEERAEAFQEDIIDIADDGTNDTMMIETKGGFEMEVTNREVIERSKLRVETRKWLMERMKPKKYGNKIDLTSDGKALPAPLFGGLSVKPEEIGPGDAKAV